MLNRSHLIGIIFGLLFCFDRIPVPFGPSNMPPIYVFSAFYCILNIFKNFYINKKALMLLLFLFVLFIHSFFMLIINGLGSSAWIFEWLEFLVKLGLVTSFILCLSNIFQECNKRLFFQGIFQGTILTILLASLHVVWMVSGIESLGDLIRNVRELFATPGFASETVRTRVASFSNEPSSFGALVFLFIFPISFMLSKNFLKKWYIIFVGIFSYSGTSLVSFFVAGFLSMKRHYKFLTISITLLITLYFSRLILEFFEDNHIVYVVSIIFSDLEKTLQIDARLGSSFFMFFESISIWSFFGSGVGSIHLLGVERLTYEFVEVLRINSKGDLNLKTLVGNIIFDFGLIISISLFFIFLRYLTYLRKDSVVKKYIVFGLIIYSFFGFSYISPIIWFWTTTLLLIDINSIVSDQTSKSHS